MHACVTVVKCECPYSAERVEAAMMCVGMC